MTDNKDDRALVERLRDLLKQATEEYSHYYVATCCSESIAAIERLTSDLLRAREALGKYGSHINDCPKNLCQPNCDWEQGCTCGLDAALKGEA